MRASPPEGIDAPEHLPFRLVRHLYWAIRTRSAVRQPFTIDHARAATQEWTTPWQQQAAMSAANCRSRGTASPARSTTTKPHHRHRDQRRDDHERQRLPCRPAGERHRPCHDDRPVRDLHPLQHPRDHRRGRRAPRRCQMDRPHRPSAPTISARSLAAARRHAHHRWKHAIASAVAPISAWITDRSTPASASAVPNECRNACGCPAATPERSR